jgi:hypothetical protein
MTDIENTRGRTKPEDDSSDEEEVANLFTFSQSSAKV